MVIMEDLGQTGPKETIEAGMKPLRLNEALEAKGDHGGQDETVEAKRGRHKAKRGIGDLNEAIEVGMRPLRPNRGLGGQTWPCRLG
uniref:Uncharacterized protein n=1 Tax=Fagus sylvatica TaxID=28930 RepID=A0A2N9GR52_FAGSY